MPLCPRLARAIENHQTDSRNLGLALSQLRERNGPGLGQSAGVVVVRRPHVDQCERLAGGQHLLDVLGREPMDDRQRAEGVGRARGHRGGDKPASSDHEQPEHSGHGSLHETKEPVRHQAITELHHHLVSPVTPDVDQVGAVGATPSTIRLAHDRQHLRRRPSLGDLRLQRRHPVVVVLFFSLDICRLPNDRSAHDQQDRQPREHDASDHGCLLAFGRTHRPPKVLHGLRPSFSGWPYKPGKPETRLMTKLTELDVPPPGGGLNTVTCATAASSRSVAGISALNSVAETYVVARLAPFQRTTELATKLVPVTVSVNPSEPTVTDGGLRLVIVGTGFRMVKVCAFDVPPPGAPVNTVPAAVPAVAMSVAGITAVSCVADTHVVVRAAPFQRTTEPATKFVPVTVSVSGGVPLDCAPPATTDAGASPVVVGTGFAIVKVCAFDVPPPGAPVNTVTAAVPAVAMSGAEITAVSCVADTHVVVRAAPFQRTTEPATKFVPVTVSVSGGVPLDCAPPATTDAGASPVVVGTGFAIVKVCEFDVPPPGAAVNTLTGAVPAVAMSA